MKYEKCKYPKCNGNIIPNRSKDFCAKHQEIAEFMMWLLTHVKVQDQNVTPSGIILPPK